MTENFNIFRDLSLSAELVSKSAVQGYKKNLTALRILKVLQ